MSDKPPVEPPGSEITSGTAPTCAAGTSCATRACSRAPAAVVAGGLYLLTRKQRRFMDAYVPDAGAVTGPVVKAKGAFDTDEPRTPYEDVTTYNNFERPGAARASPEAPAVDRHRGW